MKRSFDTLHGAKLVFNSYFDEQPGKSANLFTIRPTGRGMTQLTHFAAGGTQAYGPAWSPDGRRIVWHKVGPRVNQLFIVDARGRNQRQLTHMLGDANPSSAHWGVAR